MQQFNWETGAYPPKTLLKKGYIINKLMSSYLGTFLWEIENKWEYVNFNLIF